MTANLDTKQIDCQEHPGQHTGTLYCSPHQWAGIWECPVDGTSDTHEHDAAEIEQVEVDDSHPDRRDGYTTQIYICPTCGVELDGDPAADRAEYLAEAQSDADRGK